METQRSGSLRPVSEAKEHEPRLRLSFFPISEEEEGHTTGCLALWCWILSESHAAVARLSLLPSAWKGNQALGSKGSMSGKQTSTLR